MGGQTSVGRTDEVAGNRFAFGDTVQNFLLVRLLKRRDLCSNIVAIYDLADDGQVGANNPPHCLGDGLEVLGGLPMVVLATALERERQQDQGQVGAWLLREFSGG